MLLREKNVPTIVKQLIDKLYSKPQLDFMKHSLAIPLTLCVSQLMTMVHESQERERKIK